VKENHGALASELKGLNAAHASPMALANAAPNSQVGRIAAYAGAVQAVAAAQETLAALEADLAALSQESPRPSADIQAEIDALADPEGADAEAAASLTEELAAALSHEESTGALTAEIKALAAEIAASEQLQADALLAAAGGRTLSPEALAELHALLGLPAPEAAEPAVPVEPAAEAASLAPAEEAVEG
jgi:hypothetical protein